MATRIWLDDIRPEPGDWLRARTAQECIGLLAAHTDNSNLVEVLSLDHDLGPAEAGTGYDVLLWLERRVFNRIRPRPPRTILVHSANPVARERMRAAIVSIRRLNEAWETELRDLFGIAPGCTGDLSSEEFVRQLRDEWED